MIIILISDITNTIFTISINMIIIIIIVGRMISSASVKTLAGSDRFERSGCSSRVRNRTRRREFYIIIIIIIVITTINIIILNIIIIEPGLVSSTASSSSSTSTTPSSSYRACWVSTDLSESSCPGDAGQVQQREQAAGEGDRGQPDEAEGLDQGDEAAGDDDTKQLKTHTGHQNFVTRAWTFFLIATVTVTSRGFHLR